MSKPRQRWWRAQSSSHTGSGGAGTRSVRAHWTHVRTATPLVTLIFALTAPAVHADGWPGGGSSGQAPASGGNSWGSGSTGGSSTGSGWGSGGGSGSGGSGSGGSGSAGWGAGGSGAGNTGQGNAGQGNGNSAGNGAGAGGNGGSGQGSGAGFGAGQGQGSGAGRHRGGTSNGGGFSGAGAGSSGAGSGSGTANGNGGFSGAGNAAWPSGPAPTVAASPAPTAAPVSIPAPSSGHDSPSPASSPARPRTVTTHRRPSILAGGPDLAIGTPSVAPDGLTIPLNGAAALVLTPITSGFTSAAPGTGITPVQPATATVNPGARGAVRRPHQASATGDGFVERVVRLVRIIPDAVWIALGASLLLALAGASAAFISVRRARRQASAIAAASVAALTDPLTGVLNRRGFLLALEHELERSRRYGHPFAVAYVDVRGLKRVNDSAGHLAGDRLLSEAARLLRDSARAGDTVGRLGGDEMAVLLVEQDREGAAVVADRIHSRVSASRAALGISAPWDLTVGTAAFPEDGTDVTTLLEAADRRLYEQRGIALR